MPVNLTNGFEGCVLDNHLERGSVIGIPRGLLWHKYGILWQTFFEKLGYKVLLSSNTDKAIFDLGEAKSSDEVCLASKIYLGHVATLVGKCDAIFVPCYDNTNVRAGFCTKYQSLPDMVKATFRSDHMRFLTLRIANVKDARKTKKAFIEFATSELGVSAKDASRAYSYAFKAQAVHDRRIVLRQEESFSLLDRLKRVSQDDETMMAEVPLSILLVAHPYVAHDEYISGDIIRAIEDMNAFVIHADESDRAIGFKKSFEFSDTLPWLINRELVGSILQNKDKVDGIILLSAFPCGPDSMFDDAVMRYFNDMPILNLMIDSLSGMAGIQTRIESFVDILRFKKKGSYLGKEAEVEMTESRSSNG